MCEMFYGFKYAFFSLCPLWWLYLYEYCYEGGDNIKTLLNTHDVSYDVHMSSKYIAI